jgi:hypothetical protein
MMAMMWTSVLRLSSNGFWNVVKCVLLKQNGRRLRAARVCYAWED